MDPAAMWMFSLSPPAPDGSSCTNMATSLRKALAQPFSKLRSKQILWRYLNRNSWHKRMMFRAVGVHFRPMSADEFRRGIDCNWRWLDGESLLPGNSQTED